ILALGAVALIASKSSAKSAPPSSPKPGSGGGGGGGYTPPPATDEPANQGESAFDSLSQDEQEAIEAATARHLACAGPENEADVDSLLAALYASLEDAAEQAVDDESEFDAYALAVRKYVRIVEGYCSDMTDEEWEQFLDDPLAWDESIGREVVAHALGSQNVPEVAYLLNELMRIGASPEDIEKV